MSEGGASERMERFLRWAVYSAPLTVTALLVVVATLVGGGNIKPSAAPGNSRDPTTAPVPPAREKDGKKDSVQTPQKKGAAFSDLKDRTWMARRHMASGKGGAPRQNAGSGTTAYLQRTTHK